MRTPYLLKSRTNFVSFMYFLVNSTTDSDSLCIQVSHTQMKFVGNITVIFSHCIKKKAKVEEV